MYPEKDFEAYLQTKHAEQYEGLDDEMPDDYENWISELDPQDVIDFANEYVKSIGTYITKLGGER